MGGVSTKICTASDYSPQDTSLMQAESAEFAKKKLKLNLFKSFAKNIYNL